MVTGLTAAQTYPSKPIRVVMPNPPGGASDILARMLQPKLAGALGQALIVENRPGAYAGVLAVARAAPDGHSFVFSHIAQVIGVLFVSKELPYEPLKDLLPTMAAIESYGLIVAQASVPGNTLAEVIDYARAYPGKLTIGSSGNGTYFHLMGEVLKYHARIDMLHVPYKGVVGVINGLVGGQIDISFVGAASVKTQLKKLKILAVVEPTRNPAMPGVASINEAVPELKKLPSWFGFYAPAGVPGAIIARFHGELAKALGAPEVRAWIDQNDLIALGSTPEQSAALTRSAIDLYGFATRIAGVKPE